MYRAKTNTPQMTAELLKEYKSLQAQAKIYRAEKAKAGAYETATDTPEKRATVTREIQRAQTEQKMKELQPVINVWIETHRDAATRSALRAFVLDGLKLPDACKQAAETFGADFSNVSKRTSAAIKELR